MAFTFDHAVIYVDDLGAAITDFGALGFTTIRGGKHTKMGTQNALIVFKDRCYLELLALLPGVSREDEDVTALVGEQEGFSGYALHTSYLYDELRTMRTRGLDVSPMRDGSRTRQDGVVVEWRMATFTDSLSPFFIEDRTSRNLRVPDGEQESRHENGALGVMAIHFLVGGLNESIRRYQNILGILPQVEGNEAVFRLENVTFKLRLPVGDAEKDYQDSHVDVPYEIVLKTSDTEHGGLMDIHQAHGARIRLAGGASI